MQQSELKTDWKVQLSESSQLASPSPSWSWWPSLLLDCIGCETSFIDLEQCELVNGVLSCFWNWKYSSLCRYLVVSHWFKQWKKYVGFDNWDKYQMGEQNVYPGPVDNSGLLRGKKDKTLLWPSFTQSKTGSLLHRANGDKSKHCFLAPKSCPFGGGCRTLQLTFVFYPLTQVLPQCLLKFTVCLLHCWPSFYYHYFHLQMGMSWPSRSTSSMSLTTSWFLQRAGISLSAGMD